MFAVVVDFRVKPDRMAEFKSLVRENAKTSLRDEPGCHRFDLATDPDHPETLLLYEIYDNVAAFRDHLTSPHFEAFDRATFTMVDTKDVRTFQEVTI